MNYAWAGQACRTIGARLLSTSIESDAGLTWRVTGSMRPDGERSVKLAGGSLYGGTSGIGLFLAELAGATGHAPFRDAARRALLHAASPDLDSVRLIPSQFSGGVGVVFSIAALLRHGEDALLRERGVLILERLAKSTQPDRGLDVIAGGAGAIPALLSIRDVFDPERIGPLVEKLGESLLEQATVEAVGLSWRTGAARRANLCGLAHGASGVGWALLELWSSTGRTVFRRAAEEAFSYEDRWFLPEEGNWMDLRNKELYDHLSEDRMPELREELRDGAPLPLYEERSMSAWCHGTFGIALTRARAFELLRLERYRREVTSVLPRMVHWVESAPLGELGLCHGFMGNADALLRSAEMLGLYRLVQQVHHRVRAVTKELEGGRRGWPSVRAVDGLDPSLMTGESGVGLFLLGLSRSVPSVTLTSGSATPRFTEAVDDDHSLRERIARVNFPRCADRLESAPLRKLLSRCASFDLPVGVQVERALEADPGHPLDDSDALWADRLAYRRERAAPLDQALSTLAKHFEPEPHPDDPLVIAPWIELHRRAGSIWILFVDLSGEPRWRTQPINEPTRLLLEHLSTSRTATAATDCMKESLDVDPDSLRRWVQGQLVQLTRAGIVLAADWIEGRTLQAGPKPGDANSTSLGSDTEVRSDLSSTGGRTAVWTERRPLPSKEAV